MKVLTFTVLLLSATFCAAGGFAANLSGTPDNYPFRNKNLPVEERVNDLVNRMTLEEKIDLLAGYRDFYLHPCERLGIPAFKLADGPLGIASWGLFGQATAFPSALMLAASWNRDLSGKTGSMYAREWRARGIHFLLAPGVNIYRASKGARNFEYFGEDPYLTSSMVVPFIEGVQDGGVIATIKHFAGNDQEFDRYTVSTEVSERALREIYLPPFEAAVKQAGVKAVMTGYNPVNGVYNTQNKHLIDILKKEWGFRGVLMSDWACTYSAEEAANNGLDLEMGSKSCFNREQLIPLIEAGKVSKATIDDKVKRVYRVCFSMGFFDRPQQDTTLPLYNPEANRMALKSAEEGIVLLKNHRDVLPLQADKIKTIAVIGPTANPIVISDRVHSNSGIVYGGGGSSKVNPWYIVTDLDGIKRRFDKTRVLYTEGISNRFKTRLFSGSRFIAPDGQDGLKASYYKDTIAPANLVKEQTDKRVNNQWGGYPHGLQALGTDYGVCWEGAIPAERAGEMLIFVDAQGGYRLWIDGQLKLDASQSQSFDYRYTTIPVEAGKNPSIRLEYSNQRSYPAEIRLGYTYTDAVDYSEALKIARQADAVIFCAGLDGSIEYEGRDRPFELPYGQDILIQKLSQINPNTVVVLHAGGGVNMTPWIDRVPAVLHAFYPGQEGGNALAAILAGDVTPSAKLPFSIEKRWEDSPACGNYDETRKEKKIYYNEGIFTGYRGYDRKGIAPLFPFGFGLSYTQFRYDDLHVQITNPKKQEVKVSFRITNTGRRAGAEIAQLYIRDVKSAEERPAKELKGFEKISLSPGESRIVEITLGHDAFRYFNSKKNAWVFEKGEFELLVGSSSRDILLQQTIKL